MLSDKSAEHPEIKIIDFGLAHRFTSGEEYKSLSGTPQYIGEARADDCNALICRASISVAL